MIRIAHITDLHLRHHTPGLSIYPRRRSRVALERLGAVLEELQQQQIDMVAVTGDLVDAPLYLQLTQTPYDFDEKYWLKQVESDYREIRSMLNASGMKWMVTPGNHDDMRPFRTVFADCPRSFVHRGFRFVSFWDVEWENHVPRRLDGDRFLMNEVLTDSHDYPQIHLQHYLIRPQLEHRYPHNYFESEFLANHLEQSGKSIVCLSGHAHDGTEIQKHGSVYYCVGASFGQAPHSYSILEYDGEQLREQQMSAGAVQYPKSRVLFLDRDGVVSVVPSYYTGPDAMELTSGAAQAIATIRREGWKVVVVTNQSCVGQGYVNEAIVESVHNQMCRLLIEQGGQDAHPDMIVYSTGAGERAVHSEYVDESDVKPSTFHPEQALEVLQVSSEGSWFVGDRSTDLETGRRLGSKLVLVETGDGLKTWDKLPAQERQDVVRVKNLSELPSLILDG